MTLWQVKEMAEAIALAETEALEYAASLSGPPGWPTEYVGLAQGYLLFDEPAHGAEVFSLMRTSELPPDAYLDAYFDTGSERQQVIAD